MVQFKDLFTPIPRITAPSQLTINFGLCFYKDDYPFLADGNFWHVDIFQYRIAYVELELYLLSVSFFHVGMYF